MATECGLYNFCFWNLLRFLISNQFLWIFVVDMHFTGHGSRFGKTKSNFIFLLQNFYFEYLLLLTAIKKIKPTNHTQIFVQVKLSHIWFFRIFPVIYGFPLPTFSLDNTSKSGATFVTLREEGHLNVLWSSPALFGIPWDAYHLPLPGLSPATDYAENS